MHTYTATLHMPPCLWSHPFNAAALPRARRYTAGDELEEWQRAEDMMDVYECAAAAPALKPHESAIVFTNNLARSTVLGLEQPIKLAAQLQSLGIDTVFVAPAAGSVKWKHDSESKPHAPPVSVPLCTAPPLCADRKDTPGVVHVPLLVPRAVLRPGWAVARRGWKHQPNVS